MNREQILAAFARVASGGYPPNSFVRTLCMELNIPRRIRAEVVRQLTGVMRELNDRGEKDALVFAEAIASHLMDMAGES